MVGGGDGGGGGHTDSVENTSLYHCVTFCHTSPFVKGQILHSSNHKKYYRKKNYIISHARNTTALHLNGIYPWLLTNKGRSTFPSTNNYLGQLQTPQSESTILPQPVKESPAFYANRIFSTVFTRARQLSLLWAGSIQSMPLPILLKYFYMVIISQVIRYDIHGTCMGNISRRDRSLNGFKYRPVMEAQKCP